MPSVASTCWSLIQGARDGEAAEREEFARRYLPLVRACLQARWGGGALRERIEDAAQEVLLQCFKAEGALERVEDGRPGGFRAYLSGVVRNVARSLERRQSRNRERQALSRIEPPEEKVGDDSLSWALDRAWARMILREAGLLLSERAEPRLVELLQLRALEQIPQEEIARRWQISRGAVRRLYAHARHEFGKAVWDVLKTHLGDDPVAVEREWDALLSMVC